ncbi:MAG TPA: universal stress protein [Candidatus Competibacter phosphatis]|nr:universal stress protein [Candidatus Competibacter phosphatis]
MQHFKNILCAVSANKPSKTILERAVSLAENNQAQLTIVDVIPRVTARIRLPDGGPFSADLQAATTAEHLRTLQSLTKPYQQRLQIQHEVLVGTGFLEIIGAVLRNGHDLLLKSAENPSFIERIFDSDDMQLLRACPCPVLITHQEEMSNYQSILAAVDFDPEEPDTVEPDLNQKILELACSLALSDFAELHVVHVWDAPGEITIRTWSDNPDEAAKSYVQGVQSRHQTGLDHLHERLREYLGAEAYAYLSPEFHLHHGDASTAIPEIAKQLQADLVVMGTVARTGIAGLLIGNTAETILEQLTCSVLAVKPPGFVSPVKLAE